MKARLRAEFGDNDDKRLTSLRRIKHSEAANRGAHTITHRHGRSLSATNAGDERCEFFGITLIRPKFGFVADHAARNGEPLEILRGGADALREHLHALAARPFGANSAVGEVSDGTVCKAKARRYIVLTNRFLAIRRQTIGGYRDRLRFKQ